MADSSSVAAAVDRIGEMSFGSLVEAAVFAAVSESGPWVGDAPAKIADSCAVDDDGFGGEFIEGANVTGFDDTTAAAEAANQVREIAVHVGQGHIDPEAVRKSDGKLVGFGRSSSDTSPTLP